MQHFSQIVLRVCTLVLFISIAISYFHVTSSIIILLLNVSSFVSLWLKPGNQMCRPERRARERKRAAAYCRTLDSFLPPAKRNRSTSDSAHSSPAASTELEATVSQDASVVAPNMSTSVADPEARKPTETSLPSVCAV